MGGIMSNARKISAAALVADIRAGMDDAALMRKYAVSEPKLKSFFSLFIEKDFLTKEELDGRGTVTEIKAAWTCPSCGKPQFNKHDECPECGILTSKLNRKTQDPTADHDKSTLVNLLSYHRVKIAWFISALFGLAIILGMSHLMKQGVQKLKQDREQALAERPKAKQAQRPDIYAPIRQQLRRLATQMKIGITRREMHQATAELAKSISDLEVALDGSNPELLEKLEEGVKRLNSGADSRYDDLREKYWNESVPVLTEAMAMMTLTPDSASNSKAPSK